MRIAAVLGLAISLLASGVAARPSIPSFDPAVCSDRVGRDETQERAAVLVATRTLESEHALRESALLAHGADEAAIEREYDAYLDARFAALAPLAARGNAAAMFKVSDVFVDRDFRYGPPPAWLPLLVCAKDMGDLQAAARLMVWFWHARGEGSFEAVQRNRVAALDIAEQAASRGGLDGILSLGVYIGGGHHFYPQDFNLGRRLLSLCARAGEAFCKEHLLGGMQGLAWGIQDRVDHYVLLRDLAAAQPHRFAARRDAVRTTLSPTDVARIDERSAAWRQVPWAALQAEWRALRLEIEAKDTPKALACRLTITCMP